MKRKIISMLLLAAIMTTALSINTYATEEYKSVDVSYQIEYGYTLHIPTSANMSKGAPLELTASDVVISDAEYLVVYLDNITTKLSGDALVLQNFDGMSCTFNIYTQDKDGGNKKQVTTTDRIMALFRMGETEACSGGTITLTPNLTGGLSSGTYKGTLHFVVEVKSEFDIAS